MILGILLFTIGILGFVINRKNIVILLISIEIILLSVTLIVLTNCYIFNDIIGQIYAIFIIAVAASESGIALAIIISYYRVNGRISIEDLYYLIN